MSRVRSGMAQSAALACLMALAACSGTSQPGGDPSRWGQGVYRAPGPAGDPWRPYIREAASRFAVPEQWIRAVMNQESGGKEYIGGHLVRSGSGAMGLMQLMPSTWRQLAGQYGLGNDPYEPHDNIIAGSGYIRQLYDRFGSPGFLAAYNAGPGRLEQYLHYGGTLPDETVNYVASIQPHLGDSAPVPGQGEVPAYTGGGVQLADNSTSAASVAAAPAAEVSRTGDGCLRNVDAAYDPSSCLVDQDTPHTDPVDNGTPVAPPLNTSPLPPPAAIASSAPAQPVRVASAAPVSSAAVSDLYPEPPVYAGRVTQPSRTVAARPVQVASVAPVISGSAHPWAVQVGAFSSGTEAQSALSQARALIGGSGRIGAVVTRVSPGAHSLYRARLVGFGPQDAASACRTLHTHSMACFTVPVQT